MNHGLNSTQQIPKKKSPPPPEVSTHNCRNWLVGKSAPTRLRDPYERLVAMFRGDYNGYGGFSGWQRTFCDVDGAIKQKMEGILSGEMCHSGKLQW